MAERPRDSQRTKILASCDDFRTMRPRDCQLPFTITGKRQDWHEAQRVLAGYAGQPWLGKFRTKYEVPDYGNWMHVYKSKRGSDHVQELQQYGAPYINLSPLRFDKIELLRYLAQTMIPADAAWHGPEFVRAFLFCIERVMGDEAQNTMRQILKLRKVRRRVESKEVRDRQRAKYEERRTERAIKRLQENLRSLE